MGAYVAEAAVAVLSDEESRALLFVGLWLCCGHRGLPCLSIPAALHLSVSPTRLLNLLRPACRELVSEAFFFCPSLWLMTDLSMGAG